MEITVFLKSAIDPLSICNLVAELLRSEYPGDVIVVAKNSERPAVMWRGVEVKLVSRPC